MDLEPKELLETLSDSKDIIILITFGILMALLGVREWYREDPPEEIFVEEDTNGDGVFSDVLIDVSGAVERPGVYRLEVGSRVGDALQAAGGLRDDADQEYVATQINLAQEIVDGAKVFVPGENATAEKSALSGDRDVASMVSLNSASADELTQLKGVGERRAETVIENRPYLSIDDAKERSGLPSRVFLDNADQISL